MKRLGILCFYDHDGIVDDYIIYLLNSMRDVLSGIYVVVNGQLSENSYAKLLKVSDSVFIRDNIGFDAGAYKYVLLNHCNVDEWDEIVLFNSTFYGPFVSWNIVFEYMREKADFWALEMDNKYGYPHLGAYFVVFGKGIIENNCFLKFWEDMLIPQNYSEDFEVFEKPFWEFFTRRGFIGASYFQSRDGVSIGNRPILRTYSCKELIEKYKFPILKYKLFSVVQYKRAQECLAYIDENTDYDINLIIQHHGRLERNNRIYPFSKEQLDTFLNRFEAIYIFGHGVYGTGIYEYCCLNEVKVKGFIVSKTENYGDYSIDEAVLGPNEGIVVALSVFYMQQVREKILDKFGEDNVLMPLSDY